VNTVIGARAFPSGRELDRFTPPRVQAADRSKPATLRSICVSASLCPDARHITADAARTVVIDFVKQQRSARVVAGVPTFCD
jgi:hypothetical protein